MEDKLDVTNSYITSVFFFFFFFFFVDAIVHKNMYSMRMFNKRFKTYVTGWL